METDPEVTEVLKSAEKNLNSYYKYIPLFKENVAIISKQMGNLSRETGIINKN